MFKTINNEFNVPIDTSALNVMRLLKYFYGFVNLDSLISNSKQEEKILIEYICTDYQLNFLIKSDILSFSNIDFSNNNIFNLLLKNLQSNKMNDSKLKSLNYGTNNTLNIFFMIAFTSSIEELKFYLLTKETESIFNIFKNKKISQDEQLFAFISEFPLFNNAINLNIDTQSSIIQYYRKLYDEFESLVMLYFKDSFKDLIFELKKVIFSLILLCLIDNYNNLKDQRHIIEKINWGLFNNDNTSLDDKLSQSKLSRTELICNIIIEKITKVFNIFTSKISNTINSTSKSLSIYFSRDNTSYFASNQLNIATVNKNSELSPPLIMYENSHNLLFEHLFQDIKNYLIQYNACKNKLEQNDNLLDELNQNNLNEFQIKLKLFKLLLRKESIDKNVLINLIDNKYKIIDGKYIIINHIVSKKEIIPIVYDIESLNKYGSSNNDINDIMILSILHPSIFNFQSIEKPIAIFFIFQLDFIMIDDSSFQLYFDYGVEVLLNI